MKITFIITIAVLAHAFAVVTGYILNPLYLVAHAFCVGAIGAKLYGHPICWQEDKLSDL